MFNRLFIRFISRISPRIQIPETTQPSHQPSVKLISCHVSHLVGRVLGLSDQPEPASLLPTGLVVFSSMHSLEALRGGANLKAQG